MAHRKSKKRKAEQALNVAVSEVMAEFGAHVKHYAAKVGDAAPENSYWIFSAYTIILPALLARLFSTQMPESASTGPAWNYGDAGFAAIVGFSQLVDSKTHRPHSSKAKGALNIGSAAQSIALTALNYAAFGSPAFAIGMGVSFLISLDETVRAFRRLESFNYWLKDSLAQLEKIEKRILGLKAKIKQLEEIKSELKTDHRSTKAVSWALRIKNEELTSLTSKKEELEDDISFRVAAVKHKEDWQENSKTSKTINKYIGKCNQDFQKTAFMVNLRAINNCRRGETIQYDSSDSILQSRISTQLRIAGNVADRKMREAGIKQKCKAELKSSLYTNFILGTAFTGMLLFCIPGMQIAAFSLIALAATMFALKYFKKGCQGLMNFFGYNKKGAKVDSAKSLPSLTASDSETSTPVSTLTSPLASSGVMSTTLVEKGDESRIFLDNSSSLKAG